MRSRPKKWTGGTTRLSLSGRPEIPTHEIMGSIYIVMEKLIVSHNLVIVIEVVPAHIAF